MFGKTFATLSSCYPELKESLLGNHNAYMQYLKINTDLFEGLTLAVH